MFCSRGEPRDRAKPLLWR